MAAVRQVGSERRKLTNEMAQQIENEVAATNEMVTARKAKAQSGKARGGKVKAK